MSIAKASTPFETVSGTLGGRAPVLGAVALTLTGYAREPAIETVDWHTSDALRTRE